MNGKLLAAICGAVLLTQSMIFSSFAEKISTDSSTQQFLQADEKEDDIIDSKDDLQTPSDDTVEPMSIANPKKSSLKVNTWSYGCPNPNTGFQNEIVPSGTDIWVVEKSYCSAIKRYYYYAGYTYNGKSHRGYFCEDNVYNGSTRLLPANVTAETNPANLKQQTSLSGTVYDGPNTTYAVMGSVGQESVKLIRTEGDYNFIEYKVDSNGRYKRGFLHYSKITGEWKSLSKKSSAKLDGKTFYIRNTSNNLYLSTDKERYGRRMQQYQLTGGREMVFKLHYNASGQYYHIIPVVGYGLRSRMSMATSGEHADRAASFEKNVDQNYQRFWVVSTGQKNLYKIVPVSSYGTMTVSSRPSGSENYVNQYYTATSSQTNDRDVWCFETTKKIHSTVYYGKPADGSRSKCCWAYAAKNMVGINGRDNSAYTVDKGIKAVKGSLVNQVGSYTETAMIANYFRSGSVNSNDYVARGDLVFSQQYMLKALLKDAICLSIGPISGEGHMITAIGFEWVDCEGGDHYPGYFIIWYLCPDQGSTPLSIPYASLREFTDEITGSPATWRGTVTANNEYANHMINFQQ